MPRMVHAVTLLWFERQLYRLGPHPLELLCAEPSDSENLICCAGYAADPSLDWAGICIALSQHSLHSKVLVCTQEHRMMHPRAIGATLVVTAQLLPVPVPLTPPSP